MCNKETIMKQLETEIHNAEWANKISTECDIVFLEQLFSLLKNEKPLIHKVGDTLQYVCGECHKQIDIEDKYCRWCGKGVEWE